MKPGSVERALAYEVACGRCEYDDGVPCERSAFVYPERAADVSDAIRALGWRRDRGEGWLCPEHFRIRRNPVGSARELEAEGDAGERAGVRAGDAVPDPDGERRE